MADPAFYRMVAADLDGYAADLDEHAVLVLEAEADQLPDALFGEATPFLQSEYRLAAGDLRAGASILRGAADWARAEAAEIEAAEAAAAAAAAAAEAEAADPVDDGGSPPPGEPLFF